MGYAGSSGAWGTLGRWSSIPGGLRPGQLSCSTGHGRVRQDTFVRLSGGRIRIPDWFQAGLAAGPSDCGGTCRQFEETSPGTRIAAMMNS